MSKITAMPDQAHAERIVHFTVSDTQNPHFMQTPLFLFDENLPFFTLSNDAKLLYSVLYKRTQLSIYKGWTDANSRVFIRYAKEGLEKILRVSNKTMTKFLQELETVGLLEIHRVGLGKCNTLYLKKYVDTPAQDQEKPENGANPQTCKNYTAGSVTVTPAVVKKFPANQNEVNQTDASQNISSPPIVSTNPPAPEPEIKPDEADEKRWEANEARERIKANIDYDAIATERPEQKAFLDTIVKALTDGVTAHYSSGCMRMSGRQVPLVEIREVFFSLTKEDILDFFQHFSRQQKVVKKPDAFIRAALYNNKTTQSGKTLQLLNDQVAKNQAAAQKEAETKKASKGRNKFANFKGRDRDYAELERLERVYITNRLEKAKAYWESDEGKAEKERQEREKLEREEEQRQREERRRRIEELDRHFGVSI